MASEYLIHYGVLGQKWGVRRYQNYDGTRIKSVNRMVSDAKKHEPKITDDISSALRGTNSHMYGLDHKLKSPESIERKSKLGKDIKDAVRYTVISPEDNFVENYRIVKNRLERLGYEETRCKNYFEDYRRGLVNHKSVQTNYKTKDGYEFEIQFQTKLSQNAKDRKVPLYEESRDPKTSPERRAELIKQMRYLADNVKEPKNISLIKSH